MINKLSLLLCLYCCASTSHAALFDRGSGLIYDDDLDITWLSDANYGAGSSYDAADGNTNGGMTWFNAMDWARNLSYYDSVRDVTYDDWRLPTIQQRDPSCSSQSEIEDISFGYNCTGSEMGHLFYNELGGVANESIVTTHNSNYDLFSNVQSSHYWSSTVYSLVPTSALSFRTVNGSIGTDVKIYDHNNQFPLNAWAVRDGDVAASTVPVPATVWLFGSGLIGLIGLARRKTMT